MSVVCLPEKHGRGLAPVVPLPRGHHDWTALYRTHHRAVYARCRKVLADGSEAEDATHEVFARAFRHLEAVPDPQDQRRWLFRVATNYCLNQLRDQKRHAELLLQYDAPPCEDPSMGVLARDFAARVTRAVPAKVRRVAWLRYVDELEQREVAKVLGVSRRTVVNRLATFRVGVQRALAALQRERFGRGLQLSR